MPKKVDHVVTRPGLKPGDPVVNIPVAADLSTVPGIPLRQVDVSFYSREHPLESQTMEKAADRQWVWTVYTEEAAEYRKGHDERVKPLVAAAESANWSRRVRRCRARTFRTTSVPRPGS